MKPGYMEVIMQLFESCKEVLKERDQSFNKSTIDVIDYFPRGWDSCYTYLNENLLRLESLIESGAPQPLVEEKFVDLINYVALSYLVVAVDKFGLETKIKEVKAMPKGKYKGKKRKKRND